MKNIIGILVLLNGLIISGCTPGNLTGQNNTSESYQTFGQDINSFVLEELNNSEISGLIFMREEEKLARDVYDVLFSKWQRRVFNNIAQSEQRHTDAIKVLLDRYEIEDPIGNDNPGYFINEELQNLYNTLIAQGDVSLIDALSVGILIEEVDIVDIQNELDENVDNQDIAFVYDNLLHGSYNHLRAFVRNLSRLGITYEPQVLSSDKFNSIINQ